MRTFIALFLAASLTACGTATPQYDVVIRNGTIYDGSGSAPRRGDLAIVGDSIAAIGDVHGRGRREIDARGLAVAPGFINMLSWAVDSLIYITPAAYPAATS